MARAAHSLGEISHYVAELTKAWCSTVFYEQTFVIYVVGTGRRDDRGVEM